MTTLDLLDTRKENSLEKAKSVSRKRIKMGDCANCESFFTKSTQPLAFFLFLTFLATFYQSSDGFSQNGGWSPWSKLQTPCQISEENTNLVECGGGVRIRYRSCTMPVPQGPLGETTQYENQQNPIYVSM